MKILVTGASGQIGSYVLERFADKCDAVGVDLKPYLIKDLKDLVVKDVDVVIHLAAQVSVENSWNDPVYDAENNIIATINLLKTCSDYEVDRFVYISSAAVYGNPEYVPIDEEHPKNPISPYGVSKLAGEYYCRVFSDKIRTVIIRPFNVFSARMDPRKGDIRRSCADISKARKLGFEPKTDLRKDLEEIFEYLV